jgi:hypothetical protein
VYTNTVLAHAVQPEPVKVSIMTCRYHLPNYTKSIQEKIHVVIKKLKLLKVWQLHAALFGIYFCYIEQTAVRHIVLH